MLTMYAVKLFIVTIFGLKFVSRKTHFYLNVTFLYTLKITMWLKDTVPVGKDFYTLLKENIVPNVPRTTIF